MCPWEQIRVFNAILYHTFVRRPPILGPKALFRPMISQTHAPLLEIDYNMHKSNSTYFADLDVSRSHLISYLCRPGLRKITYNAQHRVVVDAAGRTVPGGLGIMLGAVHCSFRREIPAYKPYELWSRVLAWDRKWLYIVTHFVPKGGVRPAAWLDPKFKKMRTRPVDAAAAPAVEDWPSKVYATAVSKYVFKTGRFTVHPSIVLEQSHLLPPRPGGWRGGADDMGEIADLGDAVDGDAWDWPRIERQRRKGMEFAAQFGNLDDLQSLFDGGAGGALGKFGPG